MIGLYLLFNLYLFDHCIFNEKVVFSTKWNFLHCLSQPDGQVTFCPLGMCYASIVIAIDTYS